jgi:hypothetical protein
MKNLLKTLLTLIAGTLITFSSKAQVQNQGTPRTITEPGTFQGITKTINTNGTTTTVIVCICSESDCYTTTVDNIVNPSSGGDDCAGSLIESLAVETPVSIYDNSGLLIDSGS